MGFLAPLFLAGLAALSVPLVLHLVRRTPRGRQLFSSLMFLAPTPPQLTRRSRLDQIVLLLLRLAILGLAAFAFARPFLRESAEMALGGVPPRHVAIVVDESASMKRGNLWRQALEQVRKELDGLGPGDQFSLHVFADRVKTLVHPDEPSLVDLTAKKSAALAAIGAREPTWRSTDLGGALVAVASDLEAASEVRESPPDLQIVLVSDFQKGARLDALQAYEWPKQVRLLPRVVAPARATNAFVQLLPPGEGDEDPQPRIRVVNAADADGDQFHVDWAVADGHPPSQPGTAVYVPPGQSRVVRLPRPPDRLDSDRLLLTGDDHSFDNVFFTVPPARQHVRLVYSGPDSTEDQKGLLHFLRLALEGDPLREVQIETVPSGQPLDANSLKSAQIVLLARPVAASDLPALEAHLVGGGTLWCVTLDEPSARGLNLLLDDVEVAQAEPAPGGYLLLGEIDFTHPLFVPFASPRYSDFTGIHFWTHQAVKAAPSGRTRIVARFDNGHPAILEQDRQPGRILVFTCGWHPANSQLARSSRFVALVGGVVDQACGGASSLGSVTVGDAIRLPESPAAYRVVSPDGTEIDLPAAAISFTNAELPGVYEAKTPQESIRFAVNLSAEESNTAPLDLGQLEALGVRTGEGQSFIERVARLRQERDVELEGRQKVWRWILAGALTVLVVETWWAGRAARQSSSSVETVP